MKKPGPYHYHKSDNGTYWTDGPGNLFARFDNEPQAVQFVECMNEAWRHGRITGRQDAAIANVVELEPMKKDKP